jgi:SAM-dependent methyltransferase
MSFLSKWIDKFQGKPVPDSKINKLDFRETYYNHVSLLKQHHSYKEAMELAVGGEFEVVGILERELLKQVGLPQEGYLIDVGCGSGRLASPLSQYLEGKYLGIDVVPELVNYAQNLVHRPDWKFQVAQGLSIPEVDHVADMVCFFSVFTHLLHEQSYVYLQEAKRVLKPDGKIVFSFLDFDVPSHWPIFLSTVENVNTDTPLNVFLSKNIIHVWATHLQLKIEGIQDADQPFIELPSPVVWSNGSRMEGCVPFGQSVCILSKE